MNYKLFQIDMEKDSGNYAFLSKESAKKLGVKFPPPREVYSLAYTGTCTELDPEELFTQLNINHPSDYRARSLSVSDVLVYDIDGKELPLFCNSVGFLPIRFTDTETGELKTSFCATETGSHILLQDGDNEIKVDTETFLSRLRTFPNQRKEPVVLNPGQIYAALQCLTHMVDHYHNQRGRKTLDEWTASGMPSFDLYAKPGDTVDEAIYENFLNLFPPAALSFGYLQLGEATEHILDQDGKWKPIFMTFAQENGEWHYLGHCFFQGTENQKKPIRFLEHLKELLK